MCVPTPTSASTLNGEADDAGKLCQCFSITSARVRVHVCVCVFKVSIPLINLLYSWDMFIKFSLRVIRSSLLACFLTLNCCFSITVFNTKCLFITGSK